MESTKHVITLEVDRGTGNGTENDRQNPGSSAANCDAPEFKNDKSKIIIFSVPKNSGSEITKKQSFPESIDKDNELENNIFADLVESETLYTPVQEESASTAAVTSAIQDIASMIDSQMLQEVLRIQDQCSKLQASTSQPNNLTMEEKREELSVCEEKLEEEKEELENGKEKDSSLPKNEKSSETEELQINLSKGEDSESKMEQCEKMEASNEVDNSEEAQVSQMWKDTIIEQEKEIEGLCDMIRWLHQQLKTSRRPLLQPTVGHPSGNYLHPQFHPQTHPKLAQSIEQYKSMLKTLTDRYTEQYTRYIIVQESLRKAIDIIQDSEKTMIRELKNPVFGTLGKPKELSDLRIKLQHELEDAINGSEEMTETQNELSKIFSNYNLTLNELDIARNDSSKLRLLLERSKAQQSLHVLGEKPNQKSEGDAKSQDPEQQKQPQKDSYVTLKVIHVQKPHSKVQRPKEDQRKKDQLWLKQFQEQRQKKQEIQVQAQPPHLKVQQEYKQWLNSEQAKKRNDELASQQSVQIQQQLNQMHIQQRPIYAQQQRQPFGMGYQPAPIWNLQTQQMPVQKKQQQ